MKVLITSGGTKVPIDAVRHIGNMSSGTFGAKIALEALRAGHHVTFLMAAGSKSPLGLRLRGDEDPLHVVWAVLRNLVQRLRFGRRLFLQEYTTFTSYEDALYQQANFCNPDVVVLAAAVSDYDVAPESYVAGKLRSSENLLIRLVKLPKLIRRFSSNMLNSPALRMRKPPVLVGFKLLVGSTHDQLEQAAQSALSATECDLIVANDLRDIKAAAHKLLLVSRGLSARDVFPTPHDPNSLAREVVRVYTNLAREKGVT